MRPIWKGSLLVGRLVIPVGLAPAVSPRDVALRQLHRDCGTPLRQQNVCPVHERVVEADEVARGWEVAPGQFVIVDDDQVAVALDAGGEERAIEVVATAGLGEVRPLLAGGAYYLAPSEQGVGRKPYVAVARGLAELGGCAIGRFNWRKERLCAIAPSRGGDALVLELLHFAEDLAAAGDVNRLLARVELSEEEGQLTRELLGRLYRPLSRVDLRSRTRPLLREALEGKLAEREAIVRAEPKRTPLVPTVDLVEALRHSLRSPRQPRRARAPSGHQR
jgi:DNA end-binding protein Ku